jgi:hypothetical protein
MRVEAGGNLIMVNKMRATEVVANCLASGDCAVNMGDGLLDPLCHTMQSFLIEQFEKRVSASRYRTGLDMIELHSIIDKVSGFVDITRLEHYIIIEAIVNNHAGLEGII